MFAVSLYMRLVSDQGSQFLFDIALGCAAAIILMDLVISGIYFVVQTDITVTGIVIKHYTINGRKLIKTPNHKSVTNLNQ